MPEPRPSRDSAEVELLNIGPLADARFTVKPLTLFVGQNGAGKTLASTFLYVLQKTVWSACTDITRMLSRQFRVRPSPRAEQQEDFTPDGVVAIINRLLQSPSFKESLEQGFASEVRRAIGDPRVFVKHGNRVGHFRIQHENGWGCSARFSSGGIISDWNIPEIAVPSEHNLSVRERPSPIRWLRFADELITGLFGSWMDRPVMIPAGRAGITDSYRFLAEQVLLERHGYTRAGVSGITRDFLATLVGSESTNQLVFFVEDEDEQTYVSELFDTLIQGKLRPSSELDELFTFEVEGHKIDRNVLSSMVKELGPMIVLLQQSQLRGTTLIVDEPECHLHPKAQIDLARVFVSLVSRDVRFLLSTHSPYLAQSLSNEWIRQSRVGSLSPKSMSVVSFRGSKRGGRARNLKYSESFGFEFGEFVDAADQVQNEFVGLFE